MKVSIDSVNSNTIQNEYRNSLCNYAEFFGTFQHPENQSNDWNISLYRIMGELVFSTNGNPIWDSSPEFDLLVAKYGIDLAIVTQE
jgi:hypothetical protein